MNQGSRWPAPDPPRTRPGPGPARTGLRQAPAPRTARGIAAGSPGSRPPERPPGTPATPGTPARQQSASAA